MPLLLLSSPYSVPQAYRLVKNSIINVEQPDQELQDDEVWDDAQEVQALVSAGGSEQVSAVGREGRRAGWSACLLWLAWF